MTTVAWAGGDRRITDSRGWSPNPPGSGDIGIIAGGTAITVGETLGGSSLSLQNQTASASPALALFQSTLAANETVSTSAYPGLDYGNGSPPPDVTVLPSAYGTIDAVGVNANAGTIVSGSVGAGMYPSNSLLTVQQTIRISDVASPSGLVIQPGMFVNTGSIDVNADAALTIAGGSAYAQFVNNGAVNTLGDVTIGVAVTGTGTINPRANQYAAHGHVEFGKSVAAGQTVRLAQSGITLDDPAEFQGLITGIETSYATSSSVTLKGQHETSATFGDGVLTVYDGGATVARLRFAADPQSAETLAAGSFQIDNVPDGVLIQYSRFGQGYGVAAGSPGPASPVVLPTPTRLPAASAAPVTLASGATTIARANLDGYVLRLEGVSELDRALARRDFGRVRAAFHAIGAG